VATVTTFPRRLRPKGFQGATDFLNWKTRFEEVFSPRT
jgi:hypothetical protein